VNNRGIVGIVLGFLVDAGLSTILRDIFLFLTPNSGMLYNLLVQNSQWTLGSRVIMMLTGLIGDFAGGYVCARYAQRNLLLNAIMLAMLDILFSLMEVSFQAKSDPMSLGYVGFLLVIPTVLAGSYFGGKQTVAA